MQGEEIRRLRRLIEKGQSRKARVAFERMFATAPADPRLHKLGGALASQLPRDADLRFLLGNGLAMARHDAEALVRYREALAINPDHVAAWFGCGALLADAKKAEAAITCFEKAVQLEPGFAIAHAHLAVNLNLARQTDRARFHAERALECDPDNPTALLLMATLERQAQAPDRARTHLERLCRRSDLHGARAKVRLGQLLDSQGDYARAFALMQEGQAALSQGAEARLIDRQQLPSQLNRTLDLLARGPWTGQTGHGEPTQKADRGAPVFLIGFPRSGTTLMEQVLAAHPKVVTLDERPLVDAVVSTLPRADGVEYPDNLAGLGEAELADAREAYRSLAAEAGAGAPVVVDKMPLNVAHVPLLHRLFPDARFLMMLRDPRDCVLSGFFQDMSLNPAMIHLHNPVDAAHLYALVAQVWRESRALPGLRYREQYYERLVSDPEREVRAVLEFLELPFDRACLRHHERARTRTVYTPSYLDVAKPIYSRAVGRYRNYTQQLEPIMPLLAPYVEAFGYADNAAA